MPPTADRCDDPRLDATDLRAWCLAQAGAVEDFPFGPETSVLKVARVVSALPRRVREELGWAPESGGAPGARPLSHSPRHA